MAVLFSLEGSAGLGRHGLSSRGAGPLSADRVAYLENCIAAVGVLYRYLVKILRARGGCLGVRSR
jgi:hypothetical protein